MSDEACALGVVMKSPYHTLKQTKFMKQSLGYRFCRVEFMKLLKLLKLTESYETSEIKVV